LIEELPHLCDVLAATAIRLKTEVSDTDKAAGQDVEEEAADEIARAHGHESCGVSAAPITIAKGDHALLQGHEAFVADGDAMRVATQIAQHLLGAGHGRLAVDDPLLGHGLAQQPPPH